MERELLQYKYPFESALAPILNLLEFKRRKLNKIEWMHFLEKTKASIINNPEQYLGKELPGHEIISKLVTSVFAELLEEEPASI